MLCAYIEDFIRYVMWSGVEAELGPLAHLRIDQLFFPKPSLARCLGLLQLEPFLLLSRVFLVDP